jgi:hypothetical protein
LLAEILDPSDRLVLGHSRPKGDIRLSCDRQRHNFRPIQPKLAIDDIREGAITNSRCNGGSTFEARLLRLPATMWKSGNAEFHGEVQ